MVLGILLVCFGLVKAYRFINVLMNAEQINDSE